MQQEKRLRVGRFAGWKVGRKSSEIEDALGAIPGKHTKSAEAIEKKWDALRSGAKERKKVNEECGGGGARMELLGWGLDEFGQAWSVLCSSAALLD